ncbi:MAG: phosphodiesterase, partial [Synergistaceae bacterium]|nr:phosphodiesterase [Synergistaceae bacterium]
MKILIASDIHGSAFYCRKLVEAVNREIPDKVLLLGDILYHGPRNALPEEYDPQTVSGMLNRLNKTIKILCVRGNCDSEVDQMMLEFPIMAEYCLLSVQNAHNILIFATHGHVFNKNNMPPIS